MMKYLILYPKIRIFVLLTGITLSTCYAQKDAGAMSMTLQQALEYAWAHDGKIANSVLDEEIAKAKVKEVTGIGLPQVNASFDLKNYIQIPTSLIPGEFFGGPPGSFAKIKFGTKYNATADFSASQLLFDASYLYGLQASKTYLELNKRNTDRTRKEVTVNVTKAYYTALVGIERLKILDANLERVKKLLNDTKVLLENGFVEQLDLDRLTIAYNNLTTEKEKAGKMVELANELLKFQMGLDLGTSLTLTDKISESDFGTPDQTTLKTDYNKRPEYSALVTTRKLNYLDLKRNQSGYYPSLFMYAAYDYNAQRSTFDIFKPGEPWFPIGLVGLKMTIPVFDGLQKKYRIEQSRINLKKIDNITKDLEQGIDLDIIASRTALNNSVLSLKIQKENIKLAQSVYDNAKMKYDQGNNTNLEVITAESTLKESQTNYITALYDAIIAKVELDRAMGNLK